MHSKQGFDLSSHIFQQFFQDISGMFQFNASQIFGETGDIRQKEISKF
jgi:hypothetical protein